MHSTFGNEPVVKAEPRPHLVQALADIKKTLTKHDRAIAVMASGTGKTLVALWAAEQQAPKTVLVLVPSLVMLQQTLHEWSKHSREPFSYLAVCSDPSVDLEDRQDIKDFPSLMCYEFSRAVRDATFRKTRYRCEACDPRCELEFHRRGHPKDASAFNAQGLCRDCHEAGHDRRFLRNAAAAANCGDLGDARKHHSTTDTFRGRLVPAGTARSEASCPREQSQLLSGPWDMVLDPTGGIGPVIELRDIAAKNGSGRLIPVHPDLRQALAAYRRSLDRQRTGHPIRARRSDDAVEHRGLVQPRVPQHRSARLLVPFRTADVHHPGGAARAQGRWFVAGCPVARRSPVDPDHPTVHRRRHRCAAQAGRNDLTA